MYSNHRQKDFFWGALVGGAITTLTTLLFTTKKGKQIREQVAETCENFQDSINGALTDAKDKLEEPVEQIEKKLAHKHKN